MMITFRSEATGEVSMFEADARRLLELIGKTPEARGVITVEQMPAAIERLRQAGASEAAAPDDPGAEDEDAAVSLGQRAWPLIDMLERARREDAPVTWGV